MFAILGYSGFTDSDEALISIIKDVISKMGSATQGWIDPIFIPFFFLFLLITRNPIVELKKTPPKIEAVIIPSLDLLLSVKTLFLYSSEEELSLDLVFGEIYWELFLPFLIKSNFAL